MISQTSHSSQTSLTSPASSAQIGTATEGAVAALWAEILRVPTVGLDDGFIALGGDSISATSCINRLYKAYGCELSFGTVLDPDMTPRKLAAILDDHMRAADLESDAAGKVAG